MKNYNVQFQLNAKEALIWTNRTIKCVQIGKHWTKLHQFYIIYYQFCKIHLFQIFHNHLTNFALGKHYLNDELLFTFKLNNHNQNFKLQLRFIRSCQQRYLYVVYNVTYRLLLSRSICNWPQSSFSRKPFNETFTKLPCNNQQGSTRTLF